MDPTAFQEVSEEDDLSFERYRLNPPLLNLPQPSSSNQMPKPIHEYRQDEIPLNFYHPQSLFVIPGDETNENYSLNRSQTTSKKRKRSRMESNEVLEEHLDETRNEDLNDFNQEEKLISNLLKKKNDPKSELHHSFTRFSNGLASTSVVRDENLNHENEEATFERKRTKFGLNDLFNSTFSSSHHPQTQAKNPSRRDPSQDEEGDLEAISDDRFDQDDLSEEIDFNSPFLRRPQIQSGSSLADRRIYLEYPLESLTIEKVDLSDRYLDRLNERKDIMKWFNTEEEDLSDWDGNEIEDEELEDEIESRLKELEGLENVIGELKDEGKVELLDEDDFAFEMKESGKAQSTQEDENEEELESENEQQVERKELSFVKEEEAEDDSSEEESSGDQEDEQGEHEIIEYNEVTDDEDEEDEEEEE